MHKTGKMMVLALCMGLGRGGCWHSAQNQTWEGAGMLCTWDRAHSTGLVRGECWHCAWGWAGKGASTVYWIGGGSWHCALCMELCSMQGTDNLC